MRILYFYQYFTTPKGAWSTRAYDFSRRWVKAGHRVTVVTCVYDKTDLEPKGFVTQLDIDGIDVRLLKIRLSNKHGFAYRLWTFLLYAATASWFALRIPTDVAYVSSGPITVGFPGLVFRFLRRKPMVFEVRDLWPEGAIQLGILRQPLAIWVARLLERTCYRMSDAVVALSPGMKMAITPRCGQTPIHVVPNTAQVALADRIPALDPVPIWAQGKLIALYAGTLGLIDDCMQLVDLAEEVQRRGWTHWRVLVVGDGKQRPEIERSAENRSLHNIRFLGLKPKTQVMAWLKQATCSVFVTKDVAFLGTASPNKLFDAFAVGVPVIQTTSGWIHELVEQTGCGLNVPVGNAAAMADALALMEDAQKRGAMASAARQLGERAFNVDRLAEKALQVLDRVHMS